MHKKMFVFFSWKPTLTPAVMNSQQASFRPLRFHFLEFLYYWSTKDTCERGNIWFHGVGILFLLLFSLFLWGISLGRMSKRIHAHPYFSVIFKLKQVQNTKILFKKVLLLVLLFITVYPSWEQNSYWRDTYFLTEASNPIFIFMVQFYYDFQERAL